MSHYQHLSIKERESIWENLIKGRTLSEIAFQIGRSVATVSRELKRNSNKEGYRPSEAQSCYEKRRRKCRRTLLLEKGPLKETVCALLTGQQWSPEQISHRLAFEGKATVSYNTIYRAIENGTMEEKGVRKNRLGRYPMSKYLRRKGWRSKKKSHKNPQNFIHQTIEERPKAAETRSQFGHWEGDLVYSSLHKVYIVTLVDRRSRYLLTGISNSKKPREIAEVFYRILKDLPPKLVKTITLDRGKEFAEHTKVTSKLPHVKFYFAHPSSPWERGLNENTNGLLRQYVPKYTYKVPLSQQLLCDFTSKLNHRPRKCLHWKSPVEIFFHKSLHLT